MANKFKPVTGTGEVTQEAELKAPAAPQADSNADAVANARSRLTAALSAAAVVESEKIIVCVAGYNHAALKTDDTLEIPTAGLPGDFSMEGVQDGYFPGPSRQRFNIAEHTRDGKTLKLKIAPQV